MNLPFTTGKFFQVFHDYNIAVFPVQIFLFLLAVIVVYFTFSNSPKSRLIINLVLAFLWMWMGVVYHLLFFSAVNKAAYLFGSIFIIQAIIFMYNGLSKNSPAYNATGTQRILSSVFILYALIVYPLLGYFSGHIYPNNPTFGLPCPTTIFTLGILFLATKRLPFGAVVIPILWSFIGGSAVFKFGIIEDTGLMITGFAYALYYFVFSRRLSQAV